MRYSSGWLSSQPASCASVVASASASMMNSDLLPDPAPDDRIVAFEAQGQPFAIQHLLTHPVIDQPAQFLRRGRALPHPFELRAQAASAGRATRRFRRGAWAAARFSQP